MVDSNAVHYSTLGLPQGAGPEEVRSAYRRLTKLYHPDQDSSLDAQVKYREIRAAYEALRGKGVLPPERGSENADFQRHSSSHAYSSYQDRDFWKAREKYGMGDGAEWRMRDEEDETLYFLWIKLKIRKRPNLNRRPFSWSAFPSIIWDSVSEIAGIETFARFAFTCALLWWVIAPLTKSLAVLAMFFSLCASAVFRYYHTRSPLDKGVYFLGSLCYGVAMSVIFVTWTSLSFHRLNFITVKILYYTLVFYSASLPLWVHPIIWAASKTK
jgi:hypothetical protein